MFGISVAKAEKWQLAAHSGYLKLTVTSIVDIDYNLGLNSTRDDETQQLLKS